MSVLVLVSLLVLALALVLGESIVGITDALEVVDVHDLDGEPPKPHNHAEQHQRCQVQDKCGPEDDGGPRATEGIFIFAGVAFEVEYDKYFLSTEFQIFENLAECLGFGFFNRIKIFDDDDRMSLVFRFSKVMV